jgi:hypothetical protein
VLHYAFEYISAAHDTDNVHYIHDSRNSTVSAAVTLIVQQLYT